jgi:hypothetical protein
VIQNIHDLLILPIVSIEDKGRSLFLKGVNDGHHYFITITRKSALELQKSTELIIVNQGFKRKLAGPGYESPGLVESLREGGKRQDPRYVHEEDKRGPAR